LLAPVWLDSRIGSAGAFALYLRSSTRGMASVYIILLNWNGTADTLECLRSLRHLKYADHRVLIVDNGSAEPCTAAVAGEFPEVEVIESPENLGFAGGCNLGIRAALEAGARYVWLLNNDTVAHPNALSALVEAAQRYPRCAIVGSKILHYSRPTVIDHAGGTLNLRRGLAWHIGCGDVDRGQHDFQRSVEFVTGCSLLADAGAIREIGPLDPEYFAYWEDVDLCTRAQRAGWDVVYAPRSVVWHKGGVVSVPSRLVRYLYARNVLRYVWRHHRRLLPIASAFWIYHQLIEPVLERRYWQVPLSIAALRDALLRRRSVPAIARG
jgi:GT2 family glycosyltransferase